MMLSSTAPHGRHAVMACHATQTAFEAGVVTYRNENYRKSRRSALKCPVFRGRSTCSPNSNTVTEYRRLIAINQRHQEARHALEAQLEQSRAECEAARASLRRIREERNALQAERDALSAKIDDAQVRLNAILEKLPRGKGHSGTDSQLDLLDPGASRSGYGRRGDPARRKRMTTKQIEVAILGQPYRLACSPETEAALLEAVARVDAEMSKIRAASTVRGMDRIAVMASLSLASEPACLAGQRASWRVFSGRRNPPYNAPHERSAWYCA